MRRNSLKNSPGPSRNPGNKAVAALAAALLAAALPGLTLSTAAPALADSGQGLVAQSGSIPAVPPPDTSTLPLPDGATPSAAEQAALDTARTKAATTGQAVVVDPLTTETSTVSALPSGHLEYDSSVLPVRVKQGSNWVPIDTTLQAVSSGGYTPAATPGSLVFSGGGTQPLVTMSTSGGASLALTWPTALPTPSVSGSTLTFPSVFPSVDLQLSATEVGGFSESLVIKTAAAAANPALATLKLGIKAHDLKVASDGHGNIDATAPDGRVLFHAPAPAMWDSSTSASSSAAHSLTVSRNSTAPTSSTSTAPGPGAHVAPIGDQVTGSTLSVVPDKTLLTSSAVTYPLYEDPTWTPLWQTGYKQHFAEVQQGCPSAQNFDSTAYGNPGVGQN